MRGFANFFDAMCDWAEHEAYKKKVRCALSGNIIQNGTFKIMPGVTEPRNENDRSISELRASNLNFVKVDTFVA